MRYRAIEYVLPSQVVTNKDMIESVLRESRPHLTAAELDGVAATMGAIFERVGTRVRYRRAPGERASDLAAEAGRRALARAGMGPREIDLLLYVGVGRGFIEPATANVFLDLLGLDRATGFDVLDACASWSRAVHIARAFLRTGEHRNVMILNAEFNADLEHYALESPADLEFRFPTYTIGEAATATIVSDSEEDDDYRAEFRSYGDQRDKCLIPLANYADYLAKDGFDPPVHQFVSYGRPLMRFGLEKVVELYRSSAAFHDYAPDVIFFHGASDGMARAGLRSVGLDLDLGFYAHERFGNTVSATVPMAMAEARREGRLQRDTPALICMASAGVSIALCRFRFLD